MRAHATNAASSRNTSSLITTRFLWMDLSIRFFNGIRSLRRIPLPAAKVFNPWSIATETAAVSRQVNTRPVFVARIRPRVSGDSIRAMRHGNSRFLSSPDSE